MDLFEVVSDVARDYRAPNGERGRTALALELGENAGTFLNRLNNNLDTHPLRVKDLVRVMTATRDVRIPQAISWLAGGVHVPLPEPVFSDSALLELWAEKAKEDGDFAAAVQQYLRTGVMNAAAFELIEREGMESVAALLALMARLRAMVR